MHHLTASAAARMTVDDIVGTRQHRHVTRSAVRWSWHDLLRQGALEVRLDHRSFSATMYQDGLLFQAAFVTLSSRALPEIGPCVTGRDSGLRRGQVLREILATVSGVREKTPRCRGEC